MDSVLYMGEGRGAMRVWPTVLCRNRLTSPATGKGRDGVGPGVDGPSVPSHLEEEGWGRGDGAATVGSTMCMPEMLSLPVPISMLWFRRRGREGDPPPPRPAPS